MWHMWKNMQVQPIKQKCAVTAKFAQICKIKIT